MPAVGRKQQPSESNGAASSGGSKKSSSSKQEVLRSPNPTASPRILTAEGWKKRMLRKKMENKKSD